MAAPCGLPGFGIAAQNATDRRDDLGKTGFSRARPRPRPLHCGRADPCRPLGAYEVIEELAKSMPRPAPITVYRALDFLMANGLVHRIESRNAFLACAHDHDTAAMVAFLICERCGSVGEIPALPVAQSLNSAARASGFAPKLSVVEITGTCAHCQQAA
jgi:Fur family transcriptional regulator, zinc uptake regulator